MEKIMYEVKGYTKTGIYAVVVHAESESSAITKAKTEIKKMAHPANIKTIVADKY